MDVVELRTFKQDKTRSAKADLEPNKKKTWRKLILKTMYIYKINIYFILAEGQRTQQKKKENLWTPTTSSISFREKRNCKNKKSVTLAKCWKASRWHLL